MYVIYVNRNLTNIVLYCIYIYIYIYIYILHYSLFGLSLKLRVIFSINFTFNNKTCIKLKSDNNNCINIYLSTVT